MLIGSGISLKFVYLGLKFFFICRIIIYRPFSVQFSTWKTILGTGTNTNTIKKMMKFYINKNKLYLSLIIYLYLYLSFQFLTLKNYSQIYFFA